MDFDQMLHIMLSGSLLVSNKYMYALCRPNFKAYFNVPRITTIRKDIISLMVLSTYVSPPSQLIHLWPSVGSL